MKDTKKLKNIEEIYTSDLNKKEGITLIALVITIIILLILAGITLATLTGDNGLFTRAKQAKQNTLDAQEKENLAIGSYENSINDVINGTINSSREDVNESNLIGEEFNFVNGNEGFSQVLGEIEFSSLGVTPKNFYNIGSSSVDQNTGIANLLYQAKIEKELKNRIELNNKFEISSQIYLNNRTTANEGVVKINLYTKIDNEYTNIGLIQVGDYWGLNSQVAYTSIINNLNIAKAVYWSTNNASGRWAIVGDGQKAHFYWGNVLLKSIDYSGGLSIDKIEIEFGKYPDQNFFPTIVESLYVGEPKYYRTIIGE